MPFLQFVVGSLATKHSILMVIWITIHVQEFLMEFLPQQDRGSFNCSCLLWFPSASSLFISFQGYSKYAIAPI